MNKFLNLALLSPVIASPVLFSTSCGGNYVEPIEMYNLLDTSSLPEIHSVDSTEALSQKEINDFYIATVASNRNLFINDMVWGATNYVDEMRSSFATEDPNININKFEIGFSTPDFGQTNISHISAKDEILNTVSFKQRIHLECSKVEGSTTLSQNINIDIQYNNVLFTTYEGDETNTEQPWCISVIDPNIRDETFWYYQFDTQPWSISYSSSDEIIRTIKSSEGTPDVEIHNTEYYSGLIDSASKLYYTYQYAVTNNDYALSDAVERTAMRMLLMFNYRSILMEKVGREADLRCWSPLFSVGDTSSETTLELNVEGFSFIKPTNLNNEKPLTVTLLTKRDDGASLILPEDDELGVSYIQLNNSEKAVDLTKDMQNAYTLPATYFGAQTEAPLKKTYIVKDTDTLTFRIDYTIINADGVNEDVTKEVSIMLHYTSLILYPPTSQN